MAIPGPLDVTFKVGPDHIEGCADCAEMGALLHAPGATCNCHCHKLRASQAEASKLKVRVSNLEFIRDNLRARLAAKHEEVDELFLISSAVAALVDVIERSNTNGPPEFWQALATLTSVAEE